MFTYLLVTDDSPLSRKMVECVLFPGDSLCAHVVSQAPQNSRSSGTKTTSGGCFARQSVCSVIFHHSSMSSGVQPKFSKVDVDD